ncbi:uncharacterized protein LOC115768385 [Drosophila novamexicana]|uniref:uncharacterized protein LOC115768385 n=1 Tax=Drosophila novamexicana TaxID=47314 RepID=UPI0011E6055C|nr:uncharacterized protein LOC115768385 [Drosophila novamexicana]
MAWVLEATDKATRHSRPLPLRPRCSLRIGRCIKDQIAFGALMNRSGSDQQQKPEPELDQTRSRQRRLRLVQLPFAAYSKPANWAYAYSATLKIFVLRFDKRQKRYKMANKQMRIHFFEQPNLPWTRKYLISLVPG